MTVTPKRRILPLLCLGVSLFLALPNVARAQTAPVLDVPLLMQAFADNKEWAERQFAGREITVRGMVVETGMSKYATPCVSLADNENSEPFIICVLSRTDALKLADFKKGTRVTMTGRYYSFNEQNRVIIKQCHRVE